MRNKIFYISFSPFIDLQANVSLLSTIKRDKYLYKFLHISVFLLFESINTRIHAHIFTKLLSLKLILWKLDFPQMHYSIGIRDMQKFTLYNYFKLSEHYVDIISFQFRIHHNVLLFVRNRGKKTNVIKL